MTPKEPAHIRTIYLPLDNYEFDHGPNDKYRKNLKFIGRKKIIDKLDLLLNNRNSIGKNGAYLVTGYRGMGKTSLVREAIRKINDPSELGIKNQPFLKSFEVALSQDEVREIDLLRQISWELDRYVKAELKSKEKFENHSKIWLYLFFIVSTLITFYVFNSNSWINCIAFVRPFEDTNDLGQILLLFGFLIGLNSILCSVLLKPFACVSSSTKKAILKLENKITGLNNSLFERLFADVTKEDSQDQISFGNNNPLTFITRKVLDGLSGQTVSRQSTQNFKSASPKEIEQFLYEILRHLDLLREEQKSNNKTPIPYFVFIIDELDKVEPDYYFSPGDNESDKYIHHNSIPFHVETKARRRNEAISKLLANLKNFLNNSTAKFVFIGGRGMYDAALADIADRESFYSSIFNDVIYVPSFFKDKFSSQPGVTQLTEAYLCGIILGMNSEEKDRNLQFLTNYLENKYPFELDSPQKLFKVIHTLQNFVIFLTYRSNGSPKKLIELIEKHIEKPDVSEQKGLFEKHILLPDDGTNNGLFLRLTFRDQYRINLHSNIYRPYLIINSKHLKSLGDKLLYSTAFLIDHVLKFHKTAFSWRNLEQIPDIILSSKDPNFRQFYTEIMNFLSKKHLRETTNAVHQYKFNSKILNEIKFSSKISEDSSAAFNFTLDESYHLKSYYKKKLAAKYKEYSEINSFNKSETYIYTIGYIHSLIGDLHFFDEEFDDAIIHYMEVLQYLRSNNTSQTPIQSHNNVIIVRTSLSLGLCYEKTRMYDRAYSTYRSLILKLKHFDKTNRDGLITESKNKIWEKPYKRMQLFQRPHLALLNVIEKDRQDGITYDNLERNLQEYLEFLNLDKLQFGLFPLLGKAGIINYNFSKQKGPDSGQPKYFNRAGETNIGSSSDKKRIVTLLSDYYFSLGTMLFFKNQIFWRLLYSRNINSLKSCDNPEAISQAIIRKLNTSSKYYHPSHSSYLYYLHALITFNIPYQENIDKLKKFPDCSNSLYKMPNGKERDLSNQMRFVTNYFQDKIYNILNSDQYDFLGNILTKMGDSILASLDKESSDLIYALPVIELFAKKNPDIFGKHEFEIMDTHLSLKLVLGLYRLSYHCYRLAGKGFSAIYQYKKLLYIIRDTVSLDHKNIIQDSLLDNILKIALAFQSDNSGLANRSQLNKYRNFTEEKDGYTALIYTNLSTAPEVKELIMILETIKIKLGYYTYSKFYIGEYSTISSMFVRVIELKFKGDQERHRIRDIKGARTFLKFREDILNHRLSNEEYESLKFHLANSYFCYYETLRILNTYGVNYILNHSFKASVCYRIGEICKVLSEVEKLGLDLKSIDDTHLTVCDELATLIGGSFRYNIDYFEYLDLARIHFQLAIDMHKEGSVYKEMSKEMYILEDDFNDNLVHFCAANERFRINTGKLNSRISEIEKILSTSKIYKTISYVNKDN